MNHEQQEVSELVRNGRYFDEARRWYQALYIAPIAERSFFLVVAGLAGLIGMVGMIAFITLMPITDRPGILLSTHDPEQVIPVIERMRQRDQPLGVAMERFFLTQYVARREGYHAATFEGNEAFVRSHSDPRAFAAYEAVYGRGNARSPVNILRDVGQRIVRIQSIQLLESTEPKQAHVKFSTELEGVGTSAKTQWTATLGYYYSPPVTEEEERQEGQPATVEDAQFKVVDYAVTQTP